jgi:ABC-2 type transport system permease protein
VSGSTSQNRAAGAGGEHANRIRAIIRKEWLDLVRNRTVLATLVGLPLMLTAMATFIMVTAARAAARAIASGKPANVRGMPAHILALTDDPHLGTVLIVLFSGLMLFSIVPVVLPSIMAAHSIVGEKQARSLEPLLATPIRTWELLVGKLIAILVPAVAPSLIGYAVYVTAIALAAPPLVLGVAVSPPFLLLVGVVGPLTSGLAVTFGMMVSARVSDLQSAQGLGGLLVLPVMALGMGQMLGAVSPSLTAVVVRAVILVVLDAGALLLCISVFERETILSRWK